MMETDLAPYSYLRHSMTRGPGYTVAQLLFLFSLLINCNELETMNSLLHYIDVYSSGIKHYRNL